ncbi:holin [Terribacillus sp. DMT04]|uniref:holin n=1 Tax=Terribacillus sp. DMT04 TaxID=2850441 RepID=UPI001C2CA429|nr:holin [Terribacillus sp. DMT04]QXE00618.1 holin [Terribacillus sp. DMT04]
MEEVMTFASIISPIVIALVQLVKKTVTVNKRFLPLLSLLTGLLIGFLAWPLTDLTLVLRIWSGGLAGLAASGLYSLGKRTISNSDKDKAA